MKVFSTPSYSRVEFGATIRVVVIIFLLIAVQSLAAQTINRSEYFFDSDPGPGNGTPLVVPAPAETVTFSAPISTAGLTPGRHLLCIRTKTEEGEWSMYEAREFFIQVPIGKAEYFIDTDPGVGSAIPLAISIVSDFVFNTTVPVPMLPDGVHYLYLRIKDESGAWSLYEPTPFTVDSALPVELLEFSARKNPAGGVDISWATVSENDNDYFEVQRWIKNDIEGTFAPIGRVDGNGTTQLRHDYNFRDDPKSSGTIYYRLKQVDFDGKFVYSEAVAVHFDDHNSTISIFPNPGSDWFTLQTGGTNTDRIQVEIINAAGQQIEFYSNVNRTLMFGKDWSPGLYVVRVRITNDIMVFKIAKGK